MLSPVLPMFLKNVLKPMPHSTKHELTSSLIDVIIFDTPPLEETTDTLAIAACADASLLVIKAGKEQPQMVQKAQEILTRLQAPALGAIVNYQTPKHQSYFYVNPGQAHRDVGVELAPSNPTHSPENAQRSNATFVGTGQARGTVPMEPSSTQGTTSNMTLEMEPVSLVPASAEKSSGQPLPAITPTPNNASLVRGQLLSNSLMKSDVSTYKGQK